MVLYHLSGLYTWDLELEIICLKESALNLESDCFQYFLSQLLKDYTNPYYCIVGMGELNLRRHLGPRGKPGLV